MATINTTASKSKLVINDLSTFEDWNRSLNKFRSVNTMNPIVFNLSTFSFNENLYLTTRVDYYSNNYAKKTQGCFTTLAVLFVFFNLLISFFSETVFGITWYQLLLDFAIIVFSALTGKLAGLLYAHFSLIKIAQRMKKRLAGVYAIKHMI